MNDRHSDFGFERISNLKSEYRIRLIDRLSVAWLKIISAGTSPVLPDRLYFDHLKETPIKKWQTEKEFLLAPTSLITSRSR